MQNVLDSPVWYNKKLINGYNFCIWDWFKRGIRQVSDLYDEQGNLCSFETLKVRFGLKGTFLEYHSLVKKIPAYWNVLVNSNKIVCIMSRFSVKCNVYIQQVLKDRKGCRRFYDVMTGANKLEPNYKWIQEIGNFSNQELNNYNRVIKSIKEVKLKDFQYKINNKILVTKSFLYKINKIDNDLCEYCQLQPETICHIFLECAKVKQFWNSLRIWPINNSNIHIDLNDKSILFSYQDNNVLKNYILVVAKYYIYANKFCKKDLNLNSFVGLLEE